VEIAAEAVERARAAGKGIVRRTPLLESQTLSEICGGSIVVKAESLQRTGAFKLRGALAKLEALGEACADGVVCGSAGNHAQSLAFAARARGVRCEVFMPRDAPIAKVEACEALGAVVRPVDGSTDDAIAQAREHAAQAGHTFVHPFDDLDVIAGQATLGLELVEDVPDLARVIVPVGGGGLASGVATVVKERHPGVEVVGVRVEDRSVTIADGIAVKAPGEITGPLLDRLVDERVVVGEDDIANAIVHLVERSKLVVEGAGAVGVAALLGGRTSPSANGTTVVILSGGNVDAGLLALIARRHETNAGRRMVVLTRISDRPGALAKLLTRVADTGANLVEVQHVREGIDLHVRETAVQLTLETRGRDHADAVLRSCAAAGYDARILGTER
jgi:threonine dehydratase